MTRIYKLLSRAEWEAAVTAGGFEGSAVDLADGYIHFSTGQQAQETARKYFRNLPEVLLVAFTAEALGEGLKWEPSRGGDLFPHFYGVLDPALALDVREPEQDADGVPILGDLP